MSDSVKKIQELKDAVAHFVNEREWEQFHSPKNLSMNLSVEAAELMEKFLWVDSKDSYNEFHKNRQEIEDEVADVFMSLLCFCNQTGIDLSRALERKMIVTAEKYPVALSKGKNIKYDKL